MLIQIYISVVKGSVRQLMGISGNMLMKINTFLIINVWAIITLVGIGLAIYITMRNKW